MRIQETKKTDPTDPDPVQEHWLKPCISLDCVIFSTEILALLSLHLTVCQQP
jgi:hypothetical protein